MIRRFQIALICLALSCVSPALGQSQRGGSKNADREQLKQLQQLQGLLKSVQSGSSPARSRSGGGSGKTSADMGLGDLRQIEKMLADFQQQSRNLVKSQNSRETNAQISA
jgi:hypothetical protein